MLQQEKQQPLLLLLLLMLLLLIQLWAHMPQSYLHQVVLQAPLMLLQQLLLLLLLLLLMIQLWAHMPQSYLHQVVLQAPLMLCQSLQLQAAMQSLVTLPQSPCLARPLRVLFLLTLLDSAVWIES